MPRFRPDGGKKKETRRERASATFSVPGSGLRGAHACKRGSVWGACEVVLKAPLGDAERRVSNHDPTRALAQVVDCSELLPPLP